MRHRRFCTGSYYRIINAPSTYPQRLASNNPSQARAMLQNPNLTPQARRQLSREAGFTFSN